MVLCLSTTIARGVVYVGFSWIKAVMDALGRKPDVLSFSGNVAENWHRFERDYDIFIGCLPDNTSEARKAMLLLNLAGSEAIQKEQSFVYRPAVPAVAAVGNVPAQPAVPAEDRLSVAVLKSKFEELCSPQRNTIMERYAFNSRSQLPDESFNSFYAELRVKARSCDFNVLEEDLIRDKIVIGIRDDNVRKQLLRENRLTLQRAVTLCQVAEETEHAMNRLTMKTDAISTNRRAQFQSKPHFQSPKTNSTQEKCPRCGKAAHPRDKCPAKDSECRKCGKKGHWSVVCRSRAKTQNHQARNFKKSANAVTEESDVFLGSISDSSAAAWKVNLDVEGQEVSFRIDTGADVTVLPEKIFKTLLHPPKLAPCQIQLTSPGGSLKTLGQFSTVLKNKSSKHRLNIIVIDGTYDPLLGREAACELGLVARVQAVKTGKMDTAPVTITLRPGIAPLCTSSARRVPYPLRDAVKEELKRMETEGVIRPVTEPTEWCSPMVAVRKRSGDVRICVDLKQLNKAVCREHYTLPSLDDVAPKLKNSKLFSKLDAASGFWQIPLAEPSQLLTTFMTPYGRYAFRRMPFGITSAPEIFQRKMVEILTGLEGVEVLMDDILIHGTDLATHDERLKKCLERLKEKGVHLNNAKCEYHKESLCYFGCIISGEGIRPDPSKVQAVHDLPAPQNTAELRTVLGMIQYLAKFVSISTVIKPLTELLQKDRVWQWGPAQEKAFRAAKELICNAPTLAYYDHTKPTTVSADASSFGLGGVLLQLQEDGLKPVAFCSRTLTDAERRYSQIEKECLAAVWASEKFGVYLTGLPEYTLLTDHKPLVPLMSKKNIDECPIRCQRLLIRLMRFNPIPVYVKGKDQVVSDALSRSPLAMTRDDGELAIEVDAYVSSIQASWPASSTRLLQIKLATAQDSSLALVQRYITSEWPDCGSAVPPQVKPYFSHRHSLSIVDGLITFDNRIVIPDSLRCEMLERIHETHQGLSKCRERAAMSVWWPGIGSAMKSMVENCRVCRQHRASIRELPLQPVPLPERPWAKLAADLCEVNKRRFIVIIDYYSRWLHIDELTTTTSGALIRTFKRLFANHGIPEVLVSDNGPQFASMEFADFAKQYGFTQVFTNPYRAQENGMAERAVQEAKKILTQADPQLALLNFRATPHSATGISPARALMGRELCTRLPVLSRVLKSSGHDATAMRERDEVAKASYKKNYDRRHGVRDLSPLMPGSLALTKLDSQKTWQGPATVIGQDNRSVRLELPHGVVRRSRRHVQEVPVATETTSSDVLPPAIDQSTTPPAEITSSDRQTTRSGRVIKPIERMDL